MAIHVQHDANVSKQTTLLVGVGPPKWHVSRCDLNRSVHEDMNDISNVKTCNEIVNIS